MSESTGFDYCAVCRKTIKDPAGVFVIDGSTYCLNHIPKHYVKYEPEVKMPDEVELQSVIICAFAIYGNLSSLTVNEIERRLKSFQANAITYGEQQQRAKDAEKLRDMAIKEKERIDKPLDDIDPKWLKFADETLGKGVAEKFHNSGCRMRIKLFESAAQAIEDSK